MSGRLILNDLQIRQKITRIAYEIYERNYDVKSLTIFGIQKQGYKLAERILDELKDIFPADFSLIELAPDKKDPTSFNPDLSKYKEGINGKNVVIVDDVLNSGKTIMYSMQSILAYEPNTLQLAVLINRDHRNFPVYPDYTGLSLSTTIEEHVKLEINKKGEFKAWLE